ncbi:MAG: TetR/AcrR family transcriptional regulator [Acidobacteria bacterium]|nr:MAG: TetR/AcrR family transcriptional regulator [Acidobacteriota bacterium]
MNYKEFKKLYASSSRDIAREVFLNNKDSIQIKKEKTAVNNLEKIFDSVFKIASKKGFQAMSMRDLSRETGMSLGSLYHYFTGKEELLGIIQTHGWSIMKRNLKQISDTHEDSLRKLRTVIKGHVFLSELYRPWFYFTFMEARSIQPAQLKVVKAMEGSTQQILAEILGCGEERGVFMPGNHELTAGMIKAMQQEWYLKRWKYRKLNVSVDQFADHLVGIVEAFCLVRETG